MKPTAMASKFVFCQCIRPAAGYLIRERSHRRQCLQNGTQQEKERFSQAHAYTSGCTRPTVMVR